jgi:hypothetical protein
MYIWSSTKIYLYINIEQLTLLVKELRSLEPR